MNKFYLNEEITEYSVQPLIDFLKENEDQPVIIHIDSIGGDVFAGLQICRAIANHKAEVVAECGIIVASIASVIALSCTKMTITKDTFLMIHRPWTVVCGTAEELLSTAALLEQSGKRIQEICTAKVKDGIDTEAWFTCDTWFGYEEILNSFNDVTLEEETEINTKVLSLTNKLKTAPDSLIAIAAKLQVENEEPEVKEVVEDPVDEDIVEEAEEEVTESTDDPEVLTEEADEVEETEEADPEEEKEPEVKNELALSIINKLSKLNIC